MDHTRTAEDTDDDWGARLDARSADPATIALIAELAGRAALVDIGATHDTASRRSDLEPHPVLARAQDCAEAMSAEGPADALGPARTAALREPSRRIAADGYRLTYTVLHGDTAPITGLDIDDIEAVVEELDWPDLDPPAVAEVGYDLVTAALAGLGEPGDGDAADALHMAWGQGVAFAFAEMLLWDTAASALR